LYSIVISARNSLFDLGIFKSKKVQSKVISVGNLTLGGTGKTPTVIFISKLISQMGISNAILSRGYGRKSNGFRLVYDGNNFVCSAKECGDEIILTSNSVSVPTAVSENRVLGAKLLYDKFQNKVLILDDAFQHRWILRDVNILLLDQEFILADNSLDKMHLPSGMMRESFDSIHRADVVIINRKFNPKKNIPQNLEKFLESKPVFYANYFLEGFIDIKTKKDYTAKDFVGQKSLLVAGIAKPESFFTSLNNVNVDVTNQLIFKDHKFYTNKEVQYIRKQFYETNSYSVITTEKDAVKLVNFSKELDDIDIFYSKISLQLEEIEKFKILLLNKINK